MRQLSAVFGSGLCASVLLVSGCSPAGSRQPATSVIDPDASFYATTLQQWKDYGDAIVTFRVVTDQVDPKTSADPDVNGGLFGRIATIRVTHVFWARDRAHRPPATLSMPVWGWFIKGVDARRIVPRGEPRLEPGHTYLAAMAHFRDGWAQLAGGADAPFDRGTVGVGEWLG